MRILYIYMDSVLLVGTVDYVDNALPPPYMGFYFLQNQYLANSL